MKKIIVYIVLFLWSFVACNSVKQQTGDLQFFLIEKLQKYSTRSLSIANRIVPKNLSWKYNVDNQGFGVQVEGYYYDKINKFIKELYVSENLVFDKNSMKIYRIDEDNITIQCSYFTQDEKSYVSIVTVKNNL